MTRDEAMQDSRRLNWHLIKDVAPPELEAYYVAGMTGVVGTWIVRRITGPNPPQWASHWAIDQLGLPFTA